MSQTLPGTILPATINLAKQEETLQALNKIGYELQNLRLVLPEELKVRIPSLEQPPTDMELVVGMGTMDLMLMDSTKADYPEALQLSPTPTINEVRWEQLDHRNNYKVTGRFVAKNIAILGEAGKTALASYNTANGTNLLEEKPREKMLLPITNSSNADIPLSFYAENLWVNTVNGTITDHVSPISAVWKANSNVMEFKYEKGAWIVVFNENLTWDIDFSFSTVAQLDLSQAPEDSGDPE